MIFKEASITEKIFKGEAGASMKILNWFFDFPNKNINLNKLAKNLKIAKASAHKSVKSLVNLNFLKNEIIGKSWQISCNINHKFNKTLKMPYHLSLILNSGIINGINEKYPSAKAIILFGSYRKGDDNENSDIDIAIEIHGKKELETEEFGTLKDIGYRKNVKINLHIFSKEKIDINLFNNITNGIVLDGFLEVKN